jgi:ABC-type Mn2+/Zn2+ transport system ATPase subunit
MTAPRSTSPALLEAVGLGVDHGGVTALADVSVTLHAGEAVALVGLNGAGKSTLLRVLAGLQAARGQVVLHQAHCHHEPQSEPVAHVAQRSTARWDLPVTVLDAVLTGRHRFRRFARPYSTRDRRAALDSLDQLGIGALASRPVGRLSGGQAQRVLLARALVQQPQVLLLDEPLAGLDAPAAGALVATLLDLRDAGLAVLCALHELDVARAAFPRTLALAHGRLVGDGASTDVLSPLGLERLLNLASPAC